MIEKKKIVFTQPEFITQIEELAAKLGVTRLVASVLFRRGLTEEAAAKEFLYGGDVPFGDPWQIKNMDAAVERIVAAINKGEHITIYGDYDVDGITASSLFFLFLQQAGAHVDVYIPRRDKEGYGLNANALEQLAKQGTGLLITVDSGISGKAEVEGAASSMDIIITDHHTPPEILPPAYTIINPHQKGDNYSCKELSGAGVAFKVCQALHQRLTNTKGFWTKYVDLAALGTIADLVTLTGENREIVRYGLRQLAKTTNPGLAALIKVAGMEGKTLTSETVGFVLAPRMNAAGRLDDAMDVVKLLTCGNLEEATALATKLNEENIVRQNISKEIFQQAQTMVEAEAVPKALVLASEGWHPGVIGIVASRLVEKYNVPVVLLSLDEGRAKGSCRSIPPVNIYDALSTCQDFLEQFGGHSQAAGLSLAAKDIPGFRQRFCQAVDDMLEGKAYVPCVEPDYVLSPEEELSVEVVTKLALLEPYGQGNKAPVLAFATAKLLSAFPLGKEGEHLRLNVLHGAYKYKAICWHEGHLAKELIPPEEIALAFAAKLNSYQGKESVNLFLLALARQKENAKNNLQIEKKTVYLNNVTQLSPQQIKLRKLYPDRQGMSSCYKLLKESLGEGLTHMEELTALQTADGIALSSNILQVFQELGFISISEQRVRLEATSFNPLNNSPTYQSMEEAYLKALTEENI